MQLRTRTITKSPARAKSPRKAASPKQKSASPAKLYGKRRGASMKEPTIVDIAVGNPDFSTLVAALKKAKLVKTLNGAGNFTVFAPTNEAFAKLPAATLKHLLDHPKELEKVLLYHVYADGAPSVQVGNVKELFTVNGKPVKVTVHPNGVYINDARVVKADIKASNGVIHVIDTVLVPQ